jgi:integrase/recombinase XerD
MNEEHKRLLKEYLEDAKMGGAREQYLIGCRSRVPKLLKYLEEQDIEITCVRVKEAQGYQGFLMGIGRKDGGKYAINTVRAYVKASVSFFEFLKRTGRVQSNPFKEMKRVREEKKLPRNLLKEKEMDGFLVELLKWNECKGLKNQKRMYVTHVVAELLYSTGIRISEAAGLMVEDIDFRRSILNVREGKGGISRVCFLNEYARDVLRLYVNEMRVILSSEWNERNSGLLFGVKWRSFGKIMNRKLKAVSLKLGLPRVTNHMFRHAVGYHLLRAGCPIRHIQEILGHKAIRNTEVYTKVDKEDLKVVLDTHHPRSFKGSTPSETKEDER